MKNNPHSFCGALIKRALVTSFGLMAMAGASTSARANIDIVFDYTYAAPGFFTATTKSVLDAAALAFETRLADNLTAITSGGSSSFNAVYFNPSDSSFPDVTQNNFSVAANQLTLFVGAANLGGALGVGGPGGFSAAGFTALQLARGQAGATGAAGSQTDFAPWGGSISFDNAASWYFDTNPNTVESFAGQYDFYSVAVHEIGHVLGIGLANSWDNRIVGANFVGPAVGTQALNPGQDHWAGTATGLVGLSSQEAAMTPSIGQNERKYFTTLDYAGLSDIGWQVTAVPETSTWLMFSAGGLLLAGLRRRRAMASARAV